MTRGTVVAVWAAIGAAIGAVALLPVGYLELDGPPDCSTCTAELRTVLMGAHFPTPYNAPLMVAVGALVLGIVFALTAWGLIRIFGDSLPEHPS